MGRYYEDMRANSSALFADIKALDAIKKTLSIEMLEAGLQRFYADGCAKCNIPIDIVIKFADVHALMGYDAHTELAYVKVDGRRCELLFHPRLVESSIWEAGFVFVYKCWVLIMVLLRALEKDNSIRANFVFEAGDTGEFESVSFCSRHPKACLIVDDYFAQSNGYADFRHEAENHFRPWNERKSNFFWRGSTTGRRLAAPPAEDQSENWRWLQRLLLCHKAQEDRVAEHCDVGITNIVQISESSLVERITKSGFLKPFVARTEFMEHKFVFDIDGNSNAWAGLFCSLYGRSCVVKVESPFGYRQWYYDRLTPWKHFIPLDKDLSELRRLIDRLLTEDGYASEVAQIGYEFAGSLSLSQSIDVSASGFMSWIARAA